MIPAAMTSKDKLVVVDTNCLLRLYCSDLRPLVGGTFSGYVLKTLKELAEELKRLAEGDRHAWLSDKTIQAEVDAAVISLTLQQQNTIDTEVASVRKHGETELRRYKRVNNIRREVGLSMVDARALTAAIELEAALATDEWPLRHVAGYIDADDKGGHVELLSSVDLLHLIESAGCLSREQRINTYATWVKTGEALLRGTAERYLELFGEPPPTAQS